RLAATMSPRVRENLARLVRESPFGLLADFALSEADAARYSAHAAIHTDDRLQLEFTAPRSLYTETERLNDEVMASFRHADWPQLTVESAEGLGRADVRHALGVAYLRKGLLDRA